MPSSKIRSIANARTAIHEGTNRSLPQVLPDRDLIGAIAEHRFAETHALAMNMTITPNGDDGFDFVSRRGNTIDIKGTKLPKGRLLVRTDALSSDIYVLAIVDVERETARFVGWCTAQQVKQLAIVTKFRGINFYCVQQKHLLPFPPTSIPI